LPGKTRLRNDLLCVKWDVKLYSLKWDVKLYSLTHSLTHSHGEKVFQLGYTTSSIITTLTPLVPTAHNNHSM